MSKVNRIVAPFINDFGQVIQPNEQVIVVTTCTGQTRMKEAEYIGYVERQAFDWQERKHVMKKFAQIRTPYEKISYVHTGTDKPFNWSTFQHGVPREQQYDTVKTPATFVSTLHYNRVLARNSTVSEIAKAVY